MTDKFTTGPSPRTGIPGRAPPNSFVLNIWQKQKYCLLKVYFAPQNLKHDYDPGSQQVTFITDHVRNRPHLKLTRIGLRGGKRGNYAGPIYSGPPWWKSVVCFMLLGSSKTFRLLRFFCSFPTIVYFTWLYCISLVQ